MNWIIELDPLVGLATVLTTGTLYSGLLWGVFTISLTFLLGRFFCGWVCPFGTLHQFAGYWSKRGRSAKEKAMLNRPSPWQASKYYVLIFFLAAALVEATAVLAPSDPLLRGSLQIGLLDPIMLLYRSVNLAVLSIVDGTVLHISASRRFYEGAWTVGAVFFAAIALNFVRPRFYCRYICPLGALFGLCGRYSIFRVGKKRAECTDCLACEKNCEGACSPASEIRINECVLCMNCLKDCRHDLVTYGVYPSESGERSSPDLTRRGIVMSLAAGALAPPMFGLSATTATNRNPNLVRPPGALAEADFLKRCVKCGQCMRICPTNVIQPAGLDSGFESLWTPTLNFRIGTSGCQHNCVACGHVCPTAAIRPLSLDERMGKGKFEDKGPVRIGMAFVDHGRCLPWAMDKPCIVCQENCPVSPKAIFTQNVFAPVRGYGGIPAKMAGPALVELVDASAPPDVFATGDYYFQFRGTPDIPPTIIKKNTGREIELSAPLPDFVANPDSPRKGPADILIFLQRPQVDPEKCIGCGVCQHECPVKVLRAIRVTADNESRSRDSGMLVRGAGSTGAFNMA